MYGDADDLPGAYKGFAIDEYRSRVAGGWKKLGVLAKEGDIDTMLGHALVQARLRYGVRPSKGA